MAFRGGSTVCRDTWLVVRAESTRTCADPSGPLWRTRGGTTIVGPADQTASSAAASRRTSERVRSSTPTLTKAAVRPRGSKTWTTGFALTRSGPSRTPVRTAWPRTSATRSSSPRAPGAPAATRTRAKGRRRSTSRRTIQARARRASPAPAPPPCRLSMREPAGRPEGSRMRGRLAVGSTRYSAARPGPGARGVHSSVGSGCAGHIAATAATARPPRDPSAPVASSLNRPPQRRLHRVARRRTGGAGTGSRTGARRPRPARDR